MSEIGSFVAPPVPRFAPESLTAAHTAHGAGTTRLVPTEVTSSVDVGWTSLLLMEHENGAGDEASFETTATPDQTLAVSLRGLVELECFSGGRWRGVVREPGSFGLTPGGTTDRLRWRARDASPLRTAHLFIPQAVFDDAREEFRRVGARWDDAPLNALAARDPAIVQAVVALLGAVEAGAPDLYAQAAGQFVATHLLLRHGPGEAADRRHPGPLTDRRLARVLEYMTAHRREPLALARLAAEAGISKFHFVRLFKAATGEAPHAYLVRLRMDAARQMLRDTELTVAEVAAASGYASAAQFRAAFTRHAGHAPTAFRTRARAGSRLGPAVARLHSPR